MVIVGVAPITYNLKIAASLANNSPAKLRGPDLEDPKQTSAAKRVSFANGFAKESLFLAFLTLAFLFKTRKQENCEISSRGSLSRGRPP